MKRFMPIILILVQSAHAVDIWFDVDTAISEAPINKKSLIDDTDFKTREESVVYNQAGLDLVFEFYTPAGTYTQTAVTPTDTAGVYDWLNQGNGMYTIEIPASGGGTINNDTEGFGRFVGFATGILPWEGPWIGFRAAGLNNAFVESAYSTTRGLAGTALPDAAADAAGGLSISDAGGLDLDTQLAATNEVTAARMGALTDLIDGGRLDLIIDAILLDTGTTLDDLVDDLETRLTAVRAGYLDNLSAGAAALESTAQSILTDTAAYDTDAEHAAAIWGAASGSYVAANTFGRLARDVNDNSDAILTDTGTTLDAKIDAIDDYVDTEVAAILTDTGTTLETHLTDIKGGTFSGVTDSLEAIRDRGDAAWSTGTGTGLTALASGTAQGGSASTIQLAASETFLDSEMNGNVVKIISGTGAGQSRLITAYAQGTDTATVTPSWTTNPGADSVYEVVEGSMNLAAWLGTAAATPNAAGYPVITVKDGTGVGEIDTLSGSIVNVDLVDTTTTNSDMRGTDSAALASVATEARLAELDAANLPTDIADIPTVAEFNARTKLASQYFDPNLDLVEDVNNVATTAVNTDMRGTDSAALASVATEARLAELDAANLPADIADVPTLAEFNARSLLASAYFDPNNDTVNVGLIEGGDATDALDTAALGGANAALPKEHEISTVTSQTVFILATGSATDDNHRNGWVAILDDSDSDNTASFHRVNGYVASTKTLTIQGTPIFTVGADDSVLFLGSVPNMRDLILNTSGATFR